MQAEPVDENEEWPCNGDVDAEIPPYAAGMTDGAPALGVQQRDQCIKGDAFHCIDHLGDGCASKKDPMFGVFMRAVSSAFFVINQNDKKDLIKWLKEHRSKTDAEIDDLPRSYFMRSPHVRRHIPPPIELSNRLSVVIAAFEDVVMANGKPLFRQKSTKWQDSMLDAVAKMQKQILCGCISDPPGMEMYIITGRNSSGLATYKCIRGSSQLEVRGW